MHPYDIVILVGGIPSYFFGFMYGFVSEAQFRKHLTLAVGDAMVVNTIGLGAIAIGLRSLDLGPWSLGCLIPLPLLGFIVGASGRG